MKFDKQYIEQIELFEAAKKKKKAEKAKSNLDKDESLVSDKLMFPTEERAILNLGDSISTVTQLMGEIEEQIKDAAKAKDTAKADQLERQIDEYKEKLDKLTAAEKKAIDDFKEMIDELLKCTDDKDYIEALNTVKKKY